MPCQSLNKSKAGTKFVTLFPIFNPRVFQCVAKTLYFMSISRWLNRALKYGTNIAISFIVAQDLEVVRMAQQNIAEAVGIVPGKGFTDNGGLVDDDESGFLAASVAGMAEEGSKRRGFPEEEYRLLQTYFREVGMEPLLTPEEEIEVSVKIKKYEAKAREIKAVLEKYSKAGATRGREKPVERAKRIKRLSALFRAYSAKAKACKERFVKANLRLVVSIAKKYMGRGLPLADLIQEGNIGLIKAVEKFDHTKGYRFSTYASWWIIQSVSRALFDQTRIIRIPVRVLEQANKVHKMARAIQNCKGEVPQVEEIAKESGLSVQKLKKVINATSITMVYLDTPNLGSDDRKNSAVELITDERFSTHSIVEKIYMSKRIEEALLSLNEREREILRMRFGIGYDESYTLDEIGSRYRLTRERIRQIERRALRKLRELESGSILRNFMESETYL
jgi:RNA polymerase primary sigma factor